ncbi:Hypothetical Protein FCC1311_016282 [Hondaea fermentalgiana]|uniref:Uncharacterized protein n=1 Tax=Hondaea fermentalgiana TaxID=2315210 RepID=A0A2R5G325_9STRA|nr:Hypothetical Protein FCC1311_016282 [Hondaea fermentalgiana]|eukprot:GBG25410.1 Hypothetical Protein FCC1311_016282 [Hondaea fermentalgiana]
MQASATESATVCAKIGVCEVLMLLALLVGLAGTIFAPDLEAPTSPDLLGDAAADSLTLLWNAPIAGCFAGTCKYQLEMQKHIPISKRHQTKPQVSWQIVNGGVVEFEPGHSVHKHKVEGLEHGQAYTFRVRHWVTDMERPGEGGAWGPFSAPSKQIYAEPPPRHRHRSRNRRSPIDFSGFFRDLRVKAWSFVRGTFHVSVQTVHLGLVGVLAGFVVLVTESYVPIVQGLDQVFSMAKLTVFFRVSLAIVVVAALERVSGSTQHMAPIVDGISSVISTVAVLGSAGTAVSLLWWHCSRFDFWLFESAPGFFVATSFFSGVFWRLSRPWVAAHFHRESSPQTVGLIMYLLWLSLMLLSILMVSMTTRALHGSLGKKQGLVYR